MKILFKKKIFSSIIIKKDALGIRKDFLFLKLLEKFWMKLTYLEKSNFFIACLKYSLYPKTVCNRVISERFI
jgi:hypothetical protein